MCNTEAKEHKSCSICAIDLLVYKCIKQERQKQNNTF